MSETGGAPRLPGPKTLLRSGAAPGPRGASEGDGVADPLRERGAAARRALIEEIRTHACHPVRKKGRR